MSKTTRKFVCRFCGKPLPTIWGLHHHYRLKRDCAQKQRKEYQMFKVQRMLKNFVAHASRTPTQPVEHAPDHAAPSHAVLNRTTPNRATLNRATSLRVARQRVHRRYQPCPSRLPDPEPGGEQPARNAEQAPNVAPLPNEHGRPALSSTRTGPRPIRRNPPGQAPHPSIHEEPHPDPTAGGVLRWETLEDQPKLQYNPIWFDKRIFEKGEWLGMEDLSERARADYFKQENPGIPWKTLREYRDDVARLPHGPDWHRHSMPLPNSGSIDMHAHNPLDTIKLLMANQRFKRRMRYAPVRQRALNAQGKRLYGEVWTADKWWQLQNALGWGRGATIATVILSADKTQLSVMTGGKSAWPFYITLGNISSSIRRRPSEHAYILLGYIPVTDLTGEDEWQFFHDCVEKMLEPLNEAGRTGVEMRCADGGVRLVFPLITAYIADFPEQCLTACARESGCPKCLTPKAGRGDFDNQYPPRDRADVLSAMNMSGRERTRTLKSLHARPTKPFWVDFPFADIPAALTPDLLHQLHKGVFGDHLVKWVTKLLGKERLDHWLMGIPRASGIRHFSNGKSGVKQWTGKEMKSLAQVFMSVAAGCTEEAAVRVARYLLNFIYRAHLPQMSEDDLDDLESDQAGFHTLKAIFIDKGCLDSEDGTPTKDGFDGIPKFHMLSHYAHVVRELGATNNFNTETTERLHIEYVKCAWRASNHRNEIPQMAEYLQRREAWVLLRAYLSETGHLTSDDNGTDSHNCVDEFGDEVGEQAGGIGGEYELLDDEGREREDVSAAHVWRDDVIWYPKPLVSTAGNRSHVKRTGAYLMRNHGATHLIRGTQDFLESRTKSHSRRPLNPKHKFPVWPRCRLEHGRVPFLLVDPPVVENIRASPQLTDKHDEVTCYTAFDTILFVSHPTRHGLRRYTPGRIQVIFKLPPHLQFLYNKKLAYIEHFRPFPAEPDPLSGFFTTRVCEEADQVGIRYASVMSLSKIRMACHLTPVYCFRDHFASITTESDLLSSSTRFHLNDYASYFMFTLLVHWERRISQHNARRHRTDT